jgi:hypothetical protein
MGIKSETEAWGFDRVESAVLENGFYGLRRLKDTEVAEIMPRLIH